MDTETKNVLNEKIEICGCEPMTGWHRDGYCNTDLDDHGIHTVCCIVTDQFLEFCKKQGNDLITSNPDSGFTGLKAGDHWCICAGSWLDAYKAGFACSINLAATHEETLVMIPITALKEFDHKNKFH